MTNSHTITAGETLAPHTTLNLGGPALYFALASSTRALVAHLQWATANRLPVQILGGGSNTLFADSGFAGLVLKIGLSGISFSQSATGTEVRAAAGETWDHLVQQCIARGLGGIECLSGIPGLVGATPIQNVGAYGQEVKDTLVQVEALDRSTLELVHFSNANCNFAYRHSRFKGTDRDRYIITAVTYRLQAQGRPILHYPELKRHIEATVDLKPLESGQPVLAAVRQAVVQLRKKKSMILDPKDPDSRSAGSFFLNPILDSSQFQALEKRWQITGNSNSIASFSAPQGIKVAAAWLVEQAGFTKGFRHKGAGVSTKHALALVNRNGTSRDLPELAALIQQTVHQRFGVQLQSEPVLPQVFSDGKGH